MTELNLKRTGRYLLWVYLAAVFCFTVGSIRRLCSFRIFHINFIFFYIVILLLLTGGVFLYYRHLEKCQKEKRKSLGLSFMETLYKYRFLIEQLVTRDFKIKYKRSVLGVFWSFLNPLLMMCVQYVVFSKLLGRGGLVPHYAIYLLSGIVMWNGFNDCTTQAMRSITGNSQLITKVYVPKYIYPLTKVISASVNVVLSMIPLILVTVVYGLFSTPHLYLSEAVFLLPFGLFFLLIFCIGMGFLLSALMVFFHDIEFLWGVIATVWMYGTPIIYSLSMFDSEGSAKWLVKLMQFNPLYHMITFIRTIIIDRMSPAFTEYLICGGFALLMLLFGYFVFKKTEDKFILYL